MSFGDPFDSYPYVSQPPSITINGAATSIPSYASVSVSLDCRDGKLTLAWTYHQSWGPIEMEQELSFRPDSAQLTTIVDHLERWLDRLLAGAEIEELLLESQL